MTDEIRPIRIKFKDTPEEYVLEFTRATVNFTNDQGFKMSEFADKMPEMLPILFYGAFRMHHRGMSRAQTDEILFAKLHGLTVEAAKRLYELYLAPSEELIRIRDDEGEDPNALATVVL